MNAALETRGSDSKVVDLATSPDDGSSGPKYEQLRRQIVDQITSGRLRPGDALPTERWWAEQHKLARNW